MTAVSVDVLAEQVAAVRENPSLPYEKGKDLSLNDIADSVSGARSALISAIERAPDSAFDPQPNNADGEEVWSVGPIVAHCNGAMMGIGGSAVELMGLDLGDPPADLQAAAESKVMTRDEALAAATVINPSEFFAMIPDDDKLDKTETHDFFGTVSGRSWLYFVAMHEAEHVKQIEALS